jgi:chromosome segregation ATPase
MPEQMYQEVRELSKAMGRIEERLDRVLRVIEELTADHHGMDARLRHLEDQRLPERVSDHEDRLRHLEERRWPHGVVSLVAAAGATIALVWQALGH